MLNAKAEKKTYIITKTDEPWWTEGKEYKAVLNKYDEVCLVDDEGEMVLTDINDDEYVSYLKHALGYSNIIER